MNRSLYKPWSFLKYLNNLIGIGYLNISKKIKYMNNDIYKYSFLYFSLLNLMYKNKRLMTFRIKYNWEFKI